MSGLEGRGRPLDRRRFLVITAGTAAAAGVARTPLGSWLLSTPRALAAGPVSRTDRLVRAEDQVDVVVELVDAAYDPVAGTVSATTPGVPAKVRLTFPSQHTAEATIASGATPGLSGAAHRSAAPTRVVVSLPDGTPYTVAELLDLADRALVLDSRSADTVGAPPTTEPGADVTAVEAPANLVLTPTATGRFTGRTAPRTLGDVSDLWRSELVRPNGATPLVRAIWSRPGDPPGATPVPAATRALLVDATTGSTADPGVAMEARRLWLTSRGALADLAGEWATGTLAAYRHVMTSGRDLHVEVVLRGYLAPFGHAATIATVSERVFEVDAGGGTTAALQQDSFLAVSDPVVTYPWDYMPDAGRGWPFPTVEAVSVPAVPVGKAAITPPGGSAIGLSRLWAVTDAATGEDLELTYRGTDRAGAPATFTLAAVFVTDAHAYTTQDVVNGQPTPLGNLAGYYPSATAARGLADLDGQPVAYADPSPRGGAGSTRATEQLRIVLDRPELGATVPSTAKAALQAAGRPAFYPRVSRAWIQDDAAASLLGGTTGSVQVTWLDRWLEHGVGDGNVDLGFVRLAGATTLSSGDKPAGLVKPSINVEALSQTLGAGLDLPGSTPTWDPLDALGDVATFLGNLRLVDVIESVAVDVGLLSGGGHGLPTYEVRTVPGPGPLDPPLGICVELTFEPTLKSYPSSEPVFVTTPDLPDGTFPGPTRAILRLESCTPINGGIEGGTTFEATLEHFALRLPPAVPAIEIQFDHLRYLEPIGGAGDLDTKIHDWSFIGVLGWLEPVKDFLVDLLDLARMVVDGYGVVAGFDIPVPSLQLGVVGVTDLAVGLDLDLPNAGAAQVGFRLATRDDPFTVTVYGFGGSGSFEVVLDAGDIVFCEGSLAVTFEIGVDFVIVSASLSASLGMAVTYDDGEVDLTAFVELTGNASLLGIVDITGRVLLSLTYRIAAKVLKGTAEVSAEVDSLFGKSEVRTQVSVEVALDGGAAAPAARARGTSEGGATEVAGPVTSFGDRLTNDDWAAICAAYA